MVLNCKIKRTLSLVRDELRSYTLSALGLLLARTKHVACTKVEIGAGGKKRAGFVTLDLAVSADIPFDLAFGLPFPDGALDLIYAEHVLEHFSYEQVKFIIAECRRCLKEGGQLKIVVPDTRIWLDGYFDKNFQREKYCGYKFGLEYLSPIDFLNYIFYMGERHKYMFDRESVPKILMNAGFKTGALRDFEPELDSPARRYNSIYAQAVR